MDIISISGRIKSLEKRFLNASVIEKLIQSKDLSEFASMLDKSEYNISDKITTLEGLTDVFNNKKTLFIKEARKYLPSSLYHYFIIGYDYHNLNLLIKGKEGTKNSTDFSSVNFYILLDAFKTNNYKNIPDFLRLPLNVISQHKEKSPAEISLLLKKLYYETLQKFIETQNSDMLNYFISIEIDFANISSLIHKKLTNTPLEIDQLIVGGNIQREKFLKEDILWKSLKKEYKTLYTPLDVEIYEKERYRTLMEYISGGRTIPNGIEPIFFYFIAKDIEFENLKRLAIGKFYNIEPKVLSEWGIFPYQYV